MFSVKWFLKDLKQDKPVKVFSIFSCGGGSSMGYKRAGFEVIGNCEIDPEINKVYIANNCPKYNYNMDVRDFLKQELPQELYELDILDGSPPCSTFSIAGEREKNWGKAKAFREGQKKQVLDDLFFVFLDVVEKLRPKIVIAENVLGLVRGNAKGYVNLIIKRFKALGYAVQIFKLNAAYMEVPSARERIFFIANRMGYPALKLKFNYPVIRFGEIRSKTGGPSPAVGTKMRRLLDAARKTERDLGKVSLRVDGRLLYFNRAIAWDHNVAPTLVSSDEHYRGYDKTRLSSADIIAIQTFPQDYNFLTDRYEKINYICGMSVPPNMMAHIATEIWRQWLRDDKNDSNKDRQGRRPPAARIE